MRGSGLILKGHLQAPPPLTCVHIPLLCGPRQVTANTSGGPAPGGESHLPLQVQVEIRWVILAGASQGQEAAAGAQEMLQACMAYPQQETTKVAQTHELQSSPPGQTGSSFKVRASSHLSPLPQAHAGTAGSLRKSGLVLRG